MSYISAVAISLFFAVTLIGFVKDAYIAQNRGEQL
jgi:hypothetical protein